MLAGKPADGDKAEKKKKAIRCEAGLHGRGFGLNGVERERKGDTSVSKQRFASRKLEQSVNFPWITAALIFPQRWISSKLPSWLQGSRDEETWPETPEAWSWVLRVALSPQPRYHLTDLWLPLATRLLTPALAARPWSLLPRGFLFAFARRRLSSDRVWLLRPAHFLLPQSARGRPELVGRWSEVGKVAEGVRPKTAAKDYFCYLLVQTFSFPILLW